MQLRLDRVAKLLGLSVNTLKSTTARSSIWGSPAPMRGQWYALHRGQTRQHHRGDLLDEEANDLTVGIMALVAQQER